MNIYTSDKWELNKEEKAALRALKRLEAIWPETLSLQAGGNSLSVLKHGEDGNPVMIGKLNGDGRLDPEYVVATVGIEADGGDPW